MDLNNLCGSSNVLMAFLILKIVIRIIFVLVPLFVMYRAFTLFFSSVTGKNDISQHIGPLIKSLLAGFLVFLTPNIVNFAFSSLLGYSDYGFERCFIDSTTEKIEEIRLQEQQDSSNRRLEGYNKANQSVSNPDRIDVDLSPPSNSGSSSNGGDVSSTGSVSSSDIEVDVRQADWKNSINPLPNGINVCRTSVFGNRISPITGEQQYHSGDDYGIACGTPVYAIMDGIVVSSGNGCSVGNLACNGGMGNYVQIQHSDGHVSIYMHSSNVIVSNGMKVVKGQEIMKVGTTGSSTGCHLHITIKDSSGNLMKPSDFIPTSKSCY